MGGSVASVKANRGVDGLYSAKKGGAREMTKAFVVREKGTKGDVVG